MQEERLGELLQQLDRFEHQYNLKLPVDVCFLSCAHLCSYFSNHD